MRVFRTQTKLKLRLLAGGAVMISLVLANTDASGNAALPHFEPTKAVPSELGSFRLVGDARQAKIERGKAGEESTVDQLKTMTEARYRDSNGAELQISSFGWQTDSAAYAHFTSLRGDQGQRFAVAADSIGTASSPTDRGILFFRGTHTVTVTNQTGNDPRPAIELARLFAATLDDGENDVPVLVKHLPNWEAVQNSVLYAVDAEYLKRAVPNQPVLEAVQFEGGTEAVLANYGPSQLVIVEFTTPQFSVDNDQRIWMKIDELKQKGQPTPTAYRRVGNYSVFVFNAPDYNTANALVDQVKYEQVVQWLGDDPHLYEKLQRYFTQTSAGVLVAVLKSSGISLLLCLAAGAFIGTMMFRHRRARKAAAYSDAGGSIRLNLDDLTGPINTQRLLKSGKRSEQAPDS